MARGDTMSEEDGPTGCVGVVFAFLLWLIPAAFGLGLVIGRAF